MCGIVGVAFRDPSRHVPERIVRAMCGAIAHRGPDDEGIHLSGSTALGARRLSIIDLASGHQPIVNEDGAVAIAFNGEIYNYRELTDALITRGHRFRTHCDTETVLHLCEEIGSAAPARLRGMFAFAVWNDRTRELLLARDRFGIKPLYYTAGPWGIAFASELKALVRCGFTERTLDLDALDMYLELGYITAPRTPFTDVRKLEPGHTLRWHDGHIHIEPYWELPAPNPHARPAPDDVRGWVDDSVRAHLVSDVPVAAFLSGGLDSSTVVASMAAQADSPHAFVARYHGTGAERADETPLAQALADKCHAQLTVIDIRPDVAAIFEPIVEALDEPLADDSAIPTWLLAEAVARDYKVALTGIGGDELFAGYRRHLGMFAADVYRRVPLVARRAAARAVRGLRESAEGGGVSRLKRFLDGGSGGVGDRFLSFVSRLPDAERASLYAAGVRSLGPRGTARRVFREIAQDAAGRDSLTSALYIDYKSFLADDILALSDRISMAHGLEVRVPFVDDVLVDRVFPLSRGQKIGWRTPKRLLREAMRDRLPPQHFTAPKRGFVGPTGAWLRHELRSMLTDELSPARMRRLGYFEPATVDRLFDEHMSRRRDREGILWALLNFSTWHRCYVEQPQLHPVASEVRALITNATTSFPAPARWRPSCEVTHA